MSHRIPVTHQQSIQQFLRPLEVGPKHGAAQYVVRSDGIIIVGDDDSPPAKRNASPPARLDPANVAPLIRRRRIIDDDVDEGFSDIQRTSSVREITARRNPECQGDFIVHISVAYIIVCCSP